MGQDGPKDDPMEPAGDYTQERVYTRKLGVRVDRNEQRYLVRGCGIRPSKRKGKTDITMESWGFDGSLTNIAPDCRNHDPSLVHSHGNTSIRWEMFYLPEFLATHG